MSAHQEATADYAGQVGPNSAVYDFEKRGKHLEVCGDTLARMRAEAGDDGGPDCGA